MADIKLADLTALTTPSGDDILYVVDDPAGTPLDRKLALSDVFKRGTVTTSSPVIDAAQTWNSSGVTFTGIKFNATDTASAAASLLMDLQVGGSSRVRATKDGQLFSNGANNSGMFLFFTSGATAGFFNSAQTPGGAGNFTQCYSVAGASFVAYAGGGTRGGIFGRLNGGASLELSSSGQILFSSGSDPAGGADTILTRRAAANLRLGAADTNASAIITVTIASPAVVSWSSHGLLAGAPVNFSTTGALPTGITAGTTYYVIAVDANSFQLATSEANALAGTALNTSGTQSGTHTGFKGALPQILSVQSNSAGVSNLGGAPLRITGSQGTGTGAGGSIIFQVAPAGSSGTAQNALTEALRINSAGLVSFGGTTSSFPALKRSTTVLQTRLADDSDFATIQGKLRADVNAVAETPTATHTITITDAAGTAYKVLCVAA